MAQSVFTGYFPRKTKEFRITKEESELFDVLLKSARFHGKSTVIRVAGGWVRDKVLGKESHDIDIALNDQSGVEFSQGVNEYLSHLGKDTRTIAVIQVHYLC